MHILSWYFIYRLFREKYKQPTKQTKISSLNLVLVRWFLIELCLFTLKKISNFSEIYNFFCNQTNVMVNLAFEIFAACRGICGVTTHLVSSILLLKIFIFPDLKNQRFRFPPPWNPYYYVTYKFVWVLCLSE